jgi:hypothetical protein
MMDDPFTLTIGFFCLRAVHRQVASPHTLSRFSVWYKARIRDGDPQYPAAQAYGDWLQAFGAWREMSILEGTDEDDTTATTAPIIPPDEGE